MQHFTGYEYLLIDIANCFGHDKLTWNERIDWSQTEDSKLEKLDKEAQSPYLFRKAVRALRKAQQGLSINHIMGLDATASGIQLMAAMSGCESSARATNLINTSKREDVYSNVAKNMSEILGKEVPRADLKKPIMTYFYGSKAQPRRVLGEGKALQAFHKTMEKVLAGPYQLMQLFQKSWDPSAAYYHWFMPDGHNVYIPVCQTVDRRLEIDEADHLRCTYRCTEVRPQNKGLALAANITHSVDAYVCRQLVIRCKKVGVSVAPIHDCFYAHPNHMNVVRETYLELMLELDASKIVTGIMKQILGNYSFYYSKIKPSIGHLMKNSEYALS